MNITDNKKAQNFGRSGLIDVNNYEVNQHEYCTAKSFKSKQSTFNYW